MHTAIAVPGNVPANFVRPAQPAVAAVIQIDTKSAECLHFLPRYRRLTGLACAIVEALPAETAMKHLLATTLCISLTALCQLALADTTAQPEPVLVQSQPVAVSEQDKAMLVRADSTLKSVESSVKGYLVAFKPRMDSEARRVGVPLASFADNTLNLAYDLGNKNVMAQWTFAQSKVLGNEVRYQAFVNESGNASLVLNSRF
jgi:hypothetical protein